MTFTEIKIWCADAPSARLVPALREFLPYVPITQVDEISDATLKIAVIPGISDRAEYFELHLEGKERVSICGKDYRGLVNAAAALAQLVEYKDGAFRLPDVEIADAPEASFRSFMIDPARNLIPMDE